MTVREERIGGCRLVCGDCRALLPTLDRRQIAVVVTDPPYGIGHAVDFARRGRGSTSGTRGGKSVWSNPRSNNYPAIEGDDKPFDPAPILALDLPTVLWGGNHFADRLPPASGWLVWDKERPDDVDQATCELAWTNCVKGVRRLRHLWHGFQRASEHGENYHPMQKPVALLRWVLGLHWLPAGLVLDPYMGSGPTAVACVRSGRTFIGCESEPAYFDIAVRRVREAEGVGSLFEAVAPPTLFPAPEPTP